MQLYVQIESEQILDLLEVRSHPSAAHVAGSPFSDASVVELANGLYSINVGSPIGPLMVHGWNAPGDKIFSGYASSYVVDASGDAYATLQPSWVRDTLTAASVAATPTFPFIGGAAFHDFISLEDGFDNMLVADSVPTDATIKLLPSGTPADLTIALRAGTTNIWDVSAPSTDVDQFVEGNRLELRVAFLVDAAEKVVKRNYLVVGGVSTVSERVRMILALATASKYVVREGNDMKSIWIRPGTGTWISGERLLVQILKDANGAQISDLSTYIAQAISQ